MVFGMDINHPGYSIGFSRLVLLESESGMSWSSSFVLLIYPVLVRLKCEVQSHTYPTQVGGIWKIIRLKAYYRLRQIQIHWFLSKFYPKKAFLAPNQQEFQGVLESFLQHAFTLWLQNHCSAHDYITLSEHQLSA